MADELVAASVAPGVFLVDGAGQRAIVYVTGDGNDRWAFWNGQVFRSADSQPVHAAPRAPIDLAQELRSPMPATVVQVPAATGARVTKGQVLVVLEAMKMEIPVRSLADGTITAVHCHPGELVQADQILVEIR
jgi:biotin carboxyl carrier protein